MNKLEYLEIDECFKDLVNAIIERAIFDYQAALSILQRNKKSEVAKIRSKECETFFQSDYFEGLTDLDGEVLIELVKNMERKGRKGRIPKTIHDK